jgi:hypothetical protein
MVLLIVFLEKSWIAAFYWIPALAEMRSQLIALRGYGG